MFSCMFTTYIVPISRLYEKSYIVVVHSYDVSELPLSSERDLAQWCNERWAEKERTLKRFYTHRRFSRDVSNPDSDVNGDVTTKHDDVFNSAARNRDEARTRRILWISLLAWTLFVVATVLMLYCSEIARYCIIAQMLLFVCVKHFTAGFEHLQMDVYKWLTAVH